MTTWLVSSWVPEGESSEGREDVQLMGNFRRQLAGDVYLDLCGLAHRGVTKRPWMVPVVTVATCGEMSSLEAQHQEGVIGFVENRLNEDRSELRSLLQKGAGPQELTEWNRMRKQRMEAVWKDEELQHRSIVRKWIECPAYNTSSEERALEGKCSMLSGREGYLYGYGAQEAADVLQKNCFECR